ncbi:LysR family transcriptional regulator [Oceanobacillus saliphilus]|uniref:LysR family transcriptional regulator n=1 Tax=Oceanobacillus saliphilus TaxID=2925834 RepID=UPI00201DC8C5|nr:LysR family transcriptional regulator [Oceanobacillus saliphilus]
MEPKILSYVIMIANEKSFSKAALKLHIAQPSLSYQIIKLEKELGIDLFIRGRRGVQLTYAGKSFVKRAMEILDQFKQLRDEMVDIANMKNGQLSIGSLSITGAILLPDAISIFKREYPGIDILLIEDNLKNLESLLSYGEIEISLLSMPFINNEIEKEIIMEEEILLAVPSSHPLSRLKEVNLSMFKDESFILLKEGTSFRAKTELIFQEAGFNPSVIFESINIYTCHSLASSGIGITFIPEMALREFNKNENIVYLPIQNSKNSTREVVIAYKSDRYLSKAARSFIDIVKFVAKKYT